MSDISIHSQLIEYLRNQTIAVVSTVSPEGKPMSATVYFIVDNDFTFYFITKTFSRKHKNLEQNPNISMVVGTENKPVTVQMEGSAERIVDKDIFKERFDNFVDLLSKNNYVGPIFQLSEEDNELVIYKVKPNWLRWLDLRGEKSNGGFVQIIPPESPKH
jgi:general stress protein 26